jgi:excisionase family DNA binding protein
MNNPFTLIDARLSNIEAILSDIADNNRKQERKEQPRLLSIDEAAQFLNLAKPTLYRLTSQRLIPFSKPAGSKRLYFRLIDLEEWTQTGRKRTISEIAEQSASFVKLTDQRKAKG